MPIKKKTALLASILAGLLISVTAGTAEARHGSGGHWGGGGGHWGGGGGHWRGGHWGGMAARPHAFAGRHHFAFRHHRHHRVFAFAPYYYDYGYGYGDGCYWLKRRAIYTGSRYWWNRYYGCVNGYGYY